MDEAAAREMFETALTTQEPCFGRFFLARFLGLGGLLGRWNGGERRSKCLGGLRLRVVGVGGLSLRQLLRGLGQLLLRLTQLLLYTPRGVCLGLGHGRLCGLSCRL